jgi:hypothetical protein
MATGTDSTLLRHRMLKGSLVSNGNTQTHPLSILMAGCVNCCFQVMEKCAEALQGLGGADNLSKAAQLYRQRLQDEEGDAEEVARLTACIAKCEDEST